MIDAVICIVVAVGFLNAGYLFEDSFLRINDYEFCSNFLGGPDASFKNPGNRFTGTITKAGTSRFLETTYLELTS